jgi:hypothetical protein
VSGAGNDGELALTGHHGLGASRRTASYRRATKPAARPTDARYYDYRRIHSPPSLARPIAAPKGRKATPVGTNAS